MKKNIKLGNLFQITTFLPLISAALENSITENYATNRLLEQLTKEKIGVPFSSIMIHLFYQLVYFNGLLHKEKPSGTAFPGYQLVQISELVRNFKRCYVGVDNSPEWIIFNEKSSKLALVGGVA